MEILMRFRPNLGNQPQYSDSTMRTRRIKRTTKTGPSFDLDNAGIVSRIHDLRACFAPEFTSPIPLSAMKILSTKYPVPPELWGTETKRDTDRTSKAAKADNAEVPTELWDHHILNVFKMGDNFYRPTWCSLGFLRSLDILRNQLTAYACKLLTRSFFKWYKDHYGARFLLEALWCGLMI